MRDVWPYLVECWRTAIALRARGAATLTLIGALAALPLVWLLGGQLELTQKGLFWFAVWVTSWTLIQLLVISPFVMWRERRILDSALQVDFSRNLNGCRVETSFRNGERAVFYRLWVRPPQGQVRTGCSGTLVDIMASPAEPGNWVSIWSAERLRLTWATKTIPPETSLDLRNNRGEFLDVFCVTESGEVRFGTPGLVLPASLNLSTFMSGNIYLLCVSVGSEGEAAREIKLRLVWPSGWQNVDVEMIE